MPSPERKWNLSDVWRAVKQLMHIPLSTAERDELQRHGDGGHYDTNRRSRHRAGHASGSRTRVNQMRHDTESSDAKEICELRARSAVQDKKIERLEGKVAEQNQLLQETVAKLTSVEQAANQRTAQKTQAIGRLEGKIAKLDRDLQEKTALHSMVDRGDARIANRVQRPEANAAELNQGPQDKIAKLSNVEGAASRGSKRPALTIGHLQTKVVVLDSPVEEKTPKPLSSEDAAGQREQKTHDSSVTKQKLHHITEGEQTNKLLPRAPVGRADSISVAEVAELVRVLNAQLEQTCILIVDSLSYRQSPTSGKGSEVVSNELRDYLGLWLCHDLQRRSNEPDTEPDPLITQIVLQTGLVNVCSHIINGWTPPDIGQGSADMRSAQARTYTSAKVNNQDVNNKYLTRVLLELINAVGGSLQSGERLPPEYQEKVEDIANKAVGLHRIINEEVTSLKLVTYTIPCGTEFDSSRMEDTEGDGGETGSTPHDRVVCTMEMGLQCRKKVEPGKARQEYGVTMKAKVVLESTLEAQGS